MGWLDCILQFVLLVQFKNQIIYKKKNNGGSVFSRMVFGIFDHDLLFQYKRLFISEKGYMNFISYRSKWVCFRTCKPAKTAVINNYNNINNRNNQWPLISNHYTKKTTKYDTGNQVWVLARGEGGHFLYTCIYRRAAWLGGFLSCQIYDVENLH